MKFEIKGLKEMQDKFRRLKASLPKQIGAALYAEVQVDVTEVKRRTPVWDPARTKTRDRVKGALRASVRGTTPGLDGTTVFCLIVAGGPQAFYAVYVHEDLTAHHETGQAKYIESVIRDTTKPTISARVAKRLDLSAI